MRTLPAGDKPYYHLSLYHEIFTQNVLYLNPLSYFTQVQEQYVNMKYLTCINMQSQSGVNTKWSTQNT